MEDKKPTIYEETIAALKRFTIKEKRSMIEWLELDLPEDLDTMEGEARAKQQTLEEEGDS